MTSKNKLSTKIIMMVEGILLISSILFCTVSIYRARVGIRKAIQQRMLDIANCASGSVDGDILKTLSKDTVDSDDYRSIYDTLAVFRDNVEAEYVYSIREEGDGNYIFTMDLDQVSPAAFGDSVKYTTALDSAGNGTAAVDEIPYSDAWGEFYSAYSPVFDSSGKVAGIVAVDFSVDWFEDQLSAQTRSTVISYAIILLLSLLLAAILSILTVRPFVRMQGKLLEEKLRAESANHAKSDFLANMSHEIRTPINAVLGMNEMILREDHRAQELAGTDTKAAATALKKIDGYAQDVKQAGKNLLSIVNDILDFTKIEAGRMDLVEAPYQLSSLLNDLNNMFLFKAQDKGLDFSITADSSLPDDLHGDEVRIRQIFTNLLNNAVKYTERGYVRLTLTGEKQEDIIMLKASVQDTGIGIKKEDLEKLFTKFQRLEMEHNSTVEGTGLGLVITQRLVEMMGGEVKVESIYGKGSDFTVTIRQRVISDQPVGDLHSRFESAAQDADSYRESFRAPGAKILVVDDTKINLAVAVNLLKNTQIKVDTAAGGADAVAMAEKTAYDLILMDQRMPEMTGTEALHRIRATEGGASAASPVICLTADAVIGARDRYIAEGFTDYLTKPIDSRSLEKMLIKYLPASKVENSRSVQDGAAAESFDTTASASDGFAPLRNAGIDPGEGLKLNQNDKDFYHLILTEYAKDRDEKTRLLKESLDLQNWNDYAVHVHSLKSSSKLIGAMELAEQALALEEAANAEDGDTVRAGHDALMERYAEVVQAINSMLSGQ
jgi:signal transduction histidine kinase/CheY-like chemotaxis protein